jgi:putative transposase
MNNTYPSQEVAEALGVSSSGFYAHQRKAERPRRRHDGALAPLIAASFAASRRTYGSPRIQCDLRAAGERCGKTRIGRLMRAQGLRPRQKRRFRP